MKTVEQIIRIERQILGCYASQTKLPVFRIAEQLRTGTIKLFSDAVPSNQNSTYILKLSGVWETGNQYGLTHKFIGGSANAVIHP